MLPAFLGACSCHWPPNLSHILKCKIHISVALAQNENSRHMSLVLLGSIASIPTRCNQAIGSIDLTWVAAWLQMTVLTRGVVAQQESHLSISQKGGKAPLTALDRSTISAEPPARYNGTVQKMSAWMSPLSLDLAPCEAELTRWYQPRPLTLVMMDALSSMVQQEGNSGYFQTDGKAQLTTLGRSTTSIGPANWYNGTVQRRLFLMFPQSLGLVLHEAGLIRRCQLKPQKMTTREDCSPLEAEGVVRVGWLAPQTVGAVVGPTITVIWDRDTLHCVAAAPFVGMPLGLVVTVAIVGSEPILCPVPWLFAGIAPRTVWPLSSWQSNIQQVVFGTIDKFNSVRDMRRTLVDILEPFHHCDRALSMRTLGRVWDLLLMSACKLTAFSLEKPIEPTLEVIPMVGYWSLGESWLLSRS